MEITQNNYGYDIQFVVKTKTGTVEPLSGIQGIKFQVVEADSFRTIINGNCVVVNATLGQCKYTVQQNDFAKAGNFVASLLIQYTASKKVNTEPIFITVNKQYAPNT